jgi:hypothetical protein
MAYTTTFIGRDGSQTAFPWVTQRLGGVDAAVMVLDVNGSPLATANPLPITAPSNLPVAVQGTVPVSVAANLNTLTPPDTALGAAGATTGTVGTTSATLVAANASRKRIDISNSSTTAQVWIRPGAGTAAVGTGWLLPPQAQATYYTTLALVAISTVAATVVGIVEW